MPADDAGARGRTLVISAGDIYVEGVRCENERTVSLDRQPEPPLDPAAFPPAEPGTYGVFLHVQEQHLTATEREELREVALGGPDTATRTRTVWQAGLVAAGRRGDPTCADVAAAARQDPPRGRLRARAVPAAVSTSECIVPPNGGYRRLENQLYRVEIHDGTAAGARRTSGRATTAAWSPGSRASRPTHGERDRRRRDGVAHRPRRDGGLRPGADRRDHRRGPACSAREPGVLARDRQHRGPHAVLSNVDAVPLTHGRLPGQPDRAPLGRHAARSRSGTWIELEDGVFVEFAEGPTRPTRSAPATTGRSRRAR